MDKKHTSSFHLDLMDPPLGSQWVLKCWISLDLVSSFFQQLLTYKSTQMAWGAVNQIRLFGIVQMSRLANINIGSVLQSVHLLDATNAEVQYIAIASRSSVHFSSQAFEDA